MLKIVTDSTCNLSAQQLSTYDIRVAPVEIHLDRESYREGVNIDAASLYRHLESGGSLDTRQPRPEDFADIYRTLLESGHDALTITISSRHSATYESAVEATHLVPEARVWVFDSCSLSYGTGYMVLEAARRAARGRGVEAITDRLGEIRDTSCFLFSPSTLRYMEQSDRVGGLRDALGSAFDYRPIFTVGDGAVQLRERVRTVTAVGRRIVDRMVEMADADLGCEEPINVAVFFSRGADDAEALLARLQTRFQCQEVLMGELTPALIVHGGPGIIGLFAYHP